MKIRLKMWINADLPAPNMAMFFIMPVEDPPEDEAN
jgi:hypothetical protein